MFKFLGYVLMGVRVVMNNFRFNSNLYAHSHTWKFGLWTPQINIILTFAPTSVCSFSLGAATLMCFHLLHQQFPKVAKEINRVPRVSFHVYGSEASSNYNRRHKTALMEMPTTPTEAQSTVCA